jgi:hypothetical protein
MGATTIRTMPANRPRRVQRMQRGRAALLWGLGLFILSQATLSLYTERRAPELRDPTFEIKYRQLRRRLDACSQRPVTVVFFGSSMTVHGIDAGRLEGPLAQAAGRPVVAYNLGIHRAGPLCHLLHVRRLLERGIRPDLIVIEVSPLLHDCLDVPSDIGLLPGEMLERHEVRLVQRYAADAQRWQHWLQALLVPAYGHRLAMLNYLAQFLVPFDDRMKVWHSMDEHGWVKQEDYEPERHRQALERMRRFMGPRLATYKPGEPSMQALVELLDLLQKEHVPALLLLMPEGPQLRSLYAPGSDTGLIEQFAALGRKYGIPFVRARDWLAEDQFVDSHHATWKGAEVLTDRLGREVLAPLLDSSFRVHAKR